MPEARRTELNAWWQADGVPDVRDIIAAFWQHVRQGTVVEMPNAHHYLFRGGTEAEVVQRTREFLSAAAESPPPDRH
jgi:hypothetical protein